MEGLSGFDRSMMKRLESSALAFYELRQPQQHEERLHGAQTVFTEAEKTKTTMKRQRRASEASSSSSSSSSWASVSQVRQFSGDQALTSNCATGGRLPSQTSDTEDDVSVTGIAKELAASTYGDSNTRGPRPTAGPSNATSSCSITFSISRILGHDNTSMATSRRPGSLHHPSVHGRTTPPTERTRNQSGMASPDSSCRVAGDDLHHEVKTLNDVDVDDADLNDNDVMTRSPGTAAAVACGDVLQGLSWLQCTRYKPPKLPRSKKLKDGTKKRKLGRNPRVPFTQHQVSLLEQKFRRTHYLSSIDVAELSSALNLTENRVKIWFQNRRARERRGKDAVMTAAQPLNVAANGVGANNTAVSGVEDHHRRQMAGSIRGLICTSAAEADTADGCRRSVSPLILDDCAGGVLTAENLLRQPFPQSEFVADSHRYVVPVTSSAAVAAMMRATLDRCRSSWTVGSPRHHLTPPVTSLPVPAVAAAADLLARLSSNLSVGRPFSSAFSSPPVNLLRF